MLADVRLGEQVAEFVSVCRVCLRCSWHGAAAGRVTAVDRVDHRLALAAEHGADHCVDIRDDARRRRSGAPRLAAART